MHGWRRALARLRRCLTIVAVASLVGLPPGTAPVAAASFAAGPVTDGAPGSLRASIVAANAAAGDDVITLPAGIFPLTLTGAWEERAARGDLDITDGLVITGAGADKTTLDAAKLGDRVLHIRPGTTVTIRDLTIAGGSAKGEGGGILNEGTLTLERVDLVGNAATGDGGGIASIGGRLTVTASLLQGNRAQNGGALSNSRASQAAVANSTLSGNTAAADGGALQNVSTAPSSQTTLTLINTTVADNAAARRAGGLRNVATTALANTILAGNRAPSGSPDCQNATGPRLIASGPNLIQRTDGCAFSGPAAGRTLVADARLLALQPYGGPTAAMPPGDGSPAIDAGDPTICAAAPIANLDQRGQPFIRPRDGDRNGTAICDLGAIEIGSDGFVVRTQADSGPDSLRQALLDANRQPGRDTITFGVPGVTEPVIRLTSPLPPVTDPVEIRGGGQAGGRATLDGAAASPASSGLELNAANTATSPTVVSSLRIAGFAGAGVTVRGSYNRLDDLVVAGNQGAGVQVVAGVGTSIALASAVGNGGLGIDLGPAGVTPNDARDADAGANGLLNVPVVTRAVPTGNAVRLEGRFSSGANVRARIDFYLSSACDPSGYGEADRPLGGFAVTTDARGDAAFKQTLPLTAPLLSGQFISATATGPDGSTSEFGACTIISPANDTWPNATALSATEVSTGAPATAYLDRAGQARWYKFKVEPNSRVIVTLTDLPANYDLTLYKDIAAAVRPVGSDQDLARLGAEFAPDAFSPDAFSPDAFSPDAFSPDAFSPDAFSPDAFSPDAFSPDAFSPDAFSPDAFSPDAFSPDAFSPDAFSPDAFSPDAFSPDAFSPDAFSPDAFTGAQVRSLLAVSAFEGTAGEGIVANTWDNDGFFYVRVRGRNGAYSLDAPFRLRVTALPGACGAIGPVAGPPPTAVGGAYKTLVVTDLGRLTGDGAERAALLTRLAAFMGRSEVRGVLVDLDSANGATPHVRARAARSQADAAPECPYATNLLAAEIKAIVDAYRRANSTLEYIVILGNDDVVPFFRHPDNALLANEKNYVPPVRDRTSSQASLRLGYVLSQDQYGASTEFSFKASDLPIPALAVGRLVETPSDITGVLDAYQATAAGVVPTPRTALVTGYDFLTDAATAVKTELEAGIGRGASTLIDARGTSPLDDETTNTADTAWTAGDLRASLLGARHDLIFLAGHFSATSALAADYRTRLLTDEVAGSAVDLRNAIVFSVGCHTGYSIVNGHGVPGITREPDWAQAFARKQAALIAGTGYQYGDTDIIEYSERLYLDFAQRLRAGSGPVAIGKALVAAKQDYLAHTPALRGIHEKTYLQVTLFGLPMLSVDLPTGRVPRVTEPSAVSQTQPYAAEPGRTLGLRRHDLTLDLTGPRALVPRQVTLKDVDSAATTVATYLQGSDGVVTNPAEPVLPLESVNITAADGVARGVGFRGGRYTDQPNVWPLTGASTSELRGVHPPFLSRIFYPVRPWSVNYTEVLAGDPDGPTWLHVTPAQFRSADPTSPVGVLRAFQRLDFRLFYSGYTATTPAGNTPALAAPPAISRVVGASTGGNATFAVNVQGDPSAGIQEVWVTYTATSGPWAGVWQSLDLTQASADSALWQGTLALGTTPPDQVRYMVQAANGVGLVTMATNLGTFYTLAPPVTGGAASTLQFVNPPDRGAYGAAASVRAVLAVGAGSRANQPIFFGIGAQRRAALTDANGVAEVSLPLLGSVGPAELRASFPGSELSGPAAAARAFTIEQQASELRLVAPSPRGCAGAVSATVRGQYSDPLPGVAALQDGLGRALAQRTVLLRADRAGSSATLSEAAITDFLGCATVGQVSLPADTYALSAAFGSLVTVAGIAVDLRDERYRPSAASASLVVQPEQATVAYAGATTVPFVSPATPHVLRAMVSQENDGSPGDISLATVQFVVTGAGAPQTIQATVGPDGSASATITFTAPGLYTVEASVMGAYFSAPVTAESSAIIAVGTAARGHVTGAGAIRSDLGAQPTTSFTGTATFGFTGQLTAGMAAPLGNVQFVFQSGDVQFRSATITSFRIVGDQVTFRGTGTLNGTRTVDYIAVGLDGTAAVTPRPDAFRMRIVEAGITTYDSQLGCGPGVDLSDGAVPCTPLQSGSIVIHRN